MTNGLKKAFIGCFLVALSLFGLARLYYNLTDDFRVSNIHYAMPYHPEWELDPLTSNEDQQVNKILSQPFTYLAKGAQSYVFISQDGEFVIKFFKFKHLRPSWFYDQLANMGILTDHREKLAARKQRKLSGVFEAHKLAFHSNREESGLVFIQLNVVDNPKREVIVKDKIGISRTIALENIPFIIQKTGQSLRVVLNTKLEQADIAGAKENLSKLFEAYAAEYQKGIYDHDHGVMRNFGFRGEDPIHMDVGKLYAEESMKDQRNAKQDALLVRAKIVLWLHKSYPQYEKEITQYIDQKIALLYPNA